MRKKVARKGVKVWLDLMDYCSLEAWLAKEQRSKGVKVQRGEGIACGNEEKDN